MGNVSCFLLSSANFFSKLTFSKKSFSNTNGVSNSLDPDQNRLNVGPDLDLNCQQRLSADDTSYYKQGLFFEKTYLIVIKDETGLKSKQNACTLILIGSYGRKLVASYLKKGR